jgi:Arylsulfotransferase (ASST)
MHRPRPFLHTHLLRGGLAAALALGATLAHADGPPPGVPLDASAGDRTPPVITVLRARPGAARGLIFVAPKTAPSPTAVQGPEIVDDLGRPVWFHAVVGGDQVADFRVQRYRGEPVLTWWQGQSHTGPGHGEGVDYIVDRSYRVIATVNAGNGLAADTHEFRLTPEGTALIVVYHAVPYDLSAVGGPAAGSVFDGIVQEIDIASGAVIFEWHSLDHVALAESHAPVPTDPATTYDYFHINAVNPDEDGNLLIDARNTWAFYKVHRRTGRVIWRLGGTKSDFALGTGVPFAWQHNPLPVDRQTVRLFDNEAAPAVLPRSRVIWIRRDVWNHTATLVRAIEHPDGLSAGSQGNSQELDNGDTFVGWGQTGRLSEFDASGNLLFDASVPAGFDTYRAYRHVWHARPDSPPTATAQRNSDGTTTVHAVWNGATDVARWIVVGGAHPHALRPLESADWNGLDTSITLTTAADHVAVIAQDAAGRVLERSAAVAIEPAPSP